MAKKIIGLIILMLILASLLFAKETVFANANHTVVLENGITVDINGERVWFNNDTGYPILCNNRTLLPVRVVSELLGYDVNWDDANKMAYLVGDDGDTSVALSPNVDEVFVNSKGYTLDTVPMLFNGRLHVPVRFLAEVLGNKVSWNGETKRISIGGV